jgi:hypothetical protein
MTRQDLHGEAVFVIHQFLTGEECRRLIDRSEQAGFQTEGDATTASFSDPALARLLWERARGLIPDSLGGQAGLGLGDQFRCHRLDRGRRRLPRPAGVREAAEGEESLPEILICLNGDIEGGETVCYLFDRLLFVEPGCGSALFVAPHLTLEEMAVRTGHKYLLGTRVVHDSSGEAWGRVK